MPFIFMEFQILTKPKIASKQSYIKNSKESRHEFFEPRNILGNKIQFICERVTAVPTSCSSSKA